jgi:hypothetical protein
MSNRTIKCRIEKAIIDFKENKIKLNDLKNCIELNGHALESMPYNLIKDIDEIEYQLTQCNFADEEDCEFDIVSTLSFINTWLNNVPD